MLLLDSLFFWISTRSSSNVLEGVCTKVISAFLATRFPLSIAEKVGQFINEYLQREISGQCKYHIDVKDMKKEKFWNANFYEKSFLSIIFCSCSMLQPYCTLCWSFVLIVGVVFCMLEKIRESKCVSVYVCVCACVRARACVCV